MNTNRKTVASILILFVLVFSQFAYPQQVSAAADRYVVASGGLNTGACDSWANACTLQRALVAASSGDEVWVQQGTYVPGVNRTDTFTIPDGVAVYGGFVGTETELSQRNPDPANTILSGEIGGAGLTDNTYHVVTISDSAATSVLDGFTVTLGYIAEADGNPNGPFGAGIYIYNSSPTLNNLIVTNNRAGNTVGSGGGGIYINDSNGDPIIAPYISNTTISNNKSGRGGGLFSQNSDPILINVVFDTNQATATGGGGMNSQTVGEFDPPINPILTNVSFINNTATGGGGMFLGNSTGTLTNVTFSGNSATRRGGGMLLEDSTGVLTNITFYNNTSTNTAGVSPRGGGGLMILGSSPTLNNVTFSGNTSTANGESGSAIRVAQSTQVGDPVILNSIFWGDTTTEITSDGSGSVTINDSIVQGGCPTFTGVSCTNVLNSDPDLSALAANGGFTQTMALGTGSPAINAGDNGTCPSTDQRGVTRPQGAACDMGAYEYDTVTSFTDTTTADFNAGTVGSCIVDNTIGNGAVRLNIPSSTTCEFTSRIFDATTPVDWTTLVATITTPAGTTVTFNARTGNTASPDITWTNWQAANGNFTNPGSRYIQYRATLTTTDSGQTPVVEDVTINYTTGSISSLTAPDGVLTNWNGSFSWTGVNGATWYLLEVYTPSMTQILRKWYTSAQTNCVSGTTCSLTPPASDLSLGNGSYQWRVLDYGAYGYGIWPDFRSFSLSAACYTLTTNVSPASSGSVTVPAQTCTGGYTAGSVVQLTAVPGTGYAFSSWSGDASGTSSATSVVMNGNKTVTANMLGNTPLTPVGAMNNWNYAFGWTGQSNATWYLIEVQTSGGTQVFRQWYTSSQTNCSGGTNCSVTPTGLSLPDGDYKWRVLDYGGYGYGINSAFMNFTLSGVACYTLTTNVSPTLSGSITTPAQTCPGGYTAGSVIQLTAVPGTGYLFQNWSGDATGTANPVSVTMNGNKNVTANFKATPVLLSPTGTITSWNNTFSWTGLTNATWYLLEVYTADGSVQVFRKWYTSPQTGCSGGTACSIIPPETAGLANGNYKWRILDYGAYGYGTWTGFMNFSLDQ